MCDAAQSQCGSCPSYAATPPADSTVNSTRTPAVKNASAKSVGQYRLQSRVAAQPCQSLLRVEKDLNAMPELSDDQIITGMTDAMNTAAMRNTDDGDMPSWEDRISVFFSVSKPEIETEDYIKRLVKYAECSRSAFAIVMVYLRRLEKANEKLGISYYNMHRLLITALMLAAKMLDDRCYSNAHYARVGGISSVKEVNRLEIEMLGLLEYKLIVAPEEYIELVLTVQKQHIPRSSPVPLATTQIVRHHASSHVSHRSIPSSSRQDPPFSQQSHNVQLCYTSHQPHRYQYSSDPPPIQATGRLAEDAFLAHSTSVSNNSSSSSSISSSRMNFTSFADALNTLGIPQCTKDDLSSLVDTGESLNIGRSEFLEIIPSILTTAAFYRADISNTRHLDLRGFYAALQILGINLEYVHVFRYFEKANNDNSGYIGPEAFASVLRTVVYETGINFDHMLTRYKKAVSDGFNPDYGIVGVTAEMATSAFAAAVTDNKDFLDLETFRNALQHLQVSVDNYERVLRYFARADKERKCKISKINFLSMFADAEDEVKNNVSRPVTYIPTTMQYGSVNTVAPGAMSHSMVSNYNSARRLYQFEAPGHVNYQVLPLQDTQGYKQSEVQYGSSGVRSRVYR